MPNRTFKPNMLAVSIGAITAAVSVSAAAQSNTLELEEIVVTASARAQTVQEIPYNISAVTGDFLTDNNITDQSELLRAVSGVSVVDRGYRNSGTVNSIIIRGLNVDNGLNGDIALNAVPTVSTYVDNTPMYANFVLKDIERVEVLRGPQGTLYGSGALGGTVRYITNKPSTEGFEASVSGDFGATEGSDGGNMNIDAMVNFALSDNFAIRANVGKIDNDGIVDYVNAYVMSENGEPMISTGSDCIDPRSATDTQVLRNHACYQRVKDADWVEIDYYKVAAKWEINDASSLTLTYQNQEDATGGRRAVTLGDNNQPAGSVLHFEYDDYESGQVLLEPSSREAELFALDFEADFGFATMTYNYSNYDHVGNGDSDNGGLWVSGGQDDPAASRDWIDTFGYSGWPRPAQRAERGYQDESSIHELRLVSNSDDSKVDWLMGLFMMNQDQTVYQNSWNPGMNEFNDACRAQGGPLNPPAECAGFWPRWYDGLTERDFEYRRDVQFEEAALYGEFTYHFNDRLRATAGFRWFDNQTINDTIMGFPLVIGWTSPSVPQSIDEDDGTLLKFNISYDVCTDCMVYGTVSQGYRRGGANAVPSVDNGDPFGEPNAEAIRSYSKDEVTNYEAGIKGDYNGHNYTLSAFYVDWDQPQLNTTTAWWGFYVAMNGDKASTSGIEAELEGYLTESLHYRVGYTFVDAQLERDFLSQQTGSLVASSGASLPSSPQNVLSASLDNTWQMGGGYEIVARGNLYYQSESENFINDESALNQTHDGFALLGASLSLVADKWVATAYAKNLTNEDGVTGAFPESHWSYDTGVFENWYGNGNRQFITQPRTLGARLEYRF